VSSPPFSVWLSASTLPLPDPVVEIRWRDADLMRERTSAPGGSERETSRYRSRRGIRAKARNLPWIRCVTTAAASTVSPN